MSEMLGAPTVTVKVDTLTLPSASVTLRVMVATPCWPRAGVTVTKRLPLLAPAVKTMFALGTKLVSDEVPVRVRLPTGVCLSPKVNGSAGVLVLKRIR